MISKIKQWALSHNLMQRLMSVWGTGILLNLIAWTLGYFLLPRNVLNAALPSLNLPFATQSLVTIFLNIFLFNLLLAGGSIVFANLFRIGDVPLGYALVMYHWILFGLLLGTDSFGIPHGGKIVPSLVSLVSSSGFYEISAYTWLAVSTIELFMYRQVSWINWTTEKVRSRKQLHLQKSDITAAALALGFLIVANLREAVNIWLLHP